MAVWWYYWSQIILLQYPFVCLLCSFVSPYVLRGDIFLTDTGIFRSIMSTLNSDTANGCLFRRKGNGQFTHKEHRVQLVVQRFPFKDKHAGKWNWMFSPCFVDCGQDYESITLTLVTIGLCTVNVHMDFNVHCHYLIQNPCVMLVSVLHAVSNTGSSALRYKILRVVFPSPYLLFVIWIAGYVPQKCCCYC